MSATHSETKTDRASSADGKPRLAMAIATGLGLGYLPLTPGSWGSLLGILLGWVALHSSQWHFVPPPATGPASDLAVWSWHFAQADAALIVIVSIAGVWAADRTARYLDRKDPQIVVVDEIAGQLIAYLGLASARTFSLNWKYLLLGFILFRVLDVWKPFPARQAESLPGGLGIMADDWMAGAYAALGLWLVRILVH